LQVSLPTGYRYVRMLTDAGLLQRTADSQYTLVG
jgi:Fe2+ or Zn2+ uptake regulation protein